MPHDCTISTSSSRRRALDVIRRIFSLVLAAAYAAVLAGPAAAQTGPEPYEIPAVLSLTGQAAFADKPYVDSLRLIEAQTNATGGIQGHPLRVVFYDDGSNPQVAVTLVSQQIAKNVPLIFGPGLVATCQATLSLLAKSGPVSLCYSGLVQPVHGSFQFASGVGPLDQYRAYLTYLRERGWTRLSILTSTDASGQAGERAYDTLLASPENKMFRVLSRDHVNPADLNADAQMQHVRTANPDVLLVVVTGTPFGMVLRSFSDAGLRMPLASSAGNLAYAQMSQFKSVLPPTLLFPGSLGIVREGTDSRAVQDAKRKYFAAFDGIGIRPDGMNLIVWDITQIAVDELRRIGVHATAEQLRDAIENVRGWTGVNGVYDFHESEHRGIGSSSIVVVQWDPAKNDFSPVSKPGGHIR